MPIERRSDPAFGDPSSEVSPETRGRWQAEVRRLIALMAGHREPYTTVAAGREIVVHPNVFSPAYFTDSQWFAEEVAKLVGPGRLLDIGTGTGVVALVAALQGAEAAATDINPHAVANAEHNFSRSSLAIPCWRGDVYAALPEGETFDLIFWNHPFNRGTKTDEDALSLCGFDYQYGGLIQYITEGLRHLRPGGRLLLGTSTFAEVSRIEQIADEAGLDVVVLNRKQCPLQWRGPAVTELRMCEFLPRAR